MKAGFAIVIALSAVALMPATARIAAMVRTPEAATRTIDNLKVAYVDDTTAHTRYAAFAATADKEGYKDVARLFRATALAVKIHARNHLAVLTKLGATKPIQNSYQPAPGTTSQNLEEALKDAKNQGDSMYPTMIKEAQAEGQAEAVTSLTYALHATQQHVKLYKYALKSLETKPVGTLFFICPTCGATYADRAPAVAPLCGTPKAKFKIIK